jgi:hypothetical protein
MDESSAFSSSLVGEEGTTLLPVRAREAVQRDGKEREGWEGRTEVCGDA